MNKEIDSHSSDKDTNTQISSGLSCLVAVARMIGAIVPQDVFREVMQQKRQIAAIPELIATAQAFRLKAKKRYLKNRSLTGSPIPAIALLKDGTYIIVGNNDEKSIVLIHPSTMQPQVVPLAEFTEMWSGNLVVIKRRFRFKEIGTYYNLSWFIPIFSKYKRCFGEFLIASTFLQVFGLVTPLFTQVIIDKVLVNNGIATLDILALALLFAALFQFVIGTVRTYLLNHTTNKIDILLGAKLLRHLISLPLRYFELRRVGDTLTRVMAMESIRAFFTGTALTALVDAFFSVLFIAIMLYYSITLTMISLVIVPLFLIQNVITMPIYRKQLDAVWAAGADNNAFLVEGLTGIHTVKAMAIEPQLNNRWEKLLARYVAKSFNTSVFTIVSTNAGSIIQTLVSLSVLWFGGHMVMEGSMTIGQLIAFQMLAGQVYTPLLRLSGVWQSFQQAWMSIVRLGDIIAAQPERGLLPNGLTSSVVLGDIAFTNVTFRYSIDRPDVLHDFTLSIPQGSRLGIVGRSGSGKSTLSKLLQRLYIPQKGTVSIGGNDISQIDAIRLRRHMGTVLQDNVLFKGSIRDNIAIAMPGASIQEVIVAAKLAGAHDFILELPEGYDTKVGERGMMLSGGQRQRIAIARALLTNPPILIFDEATSALDYESERIIVQNLDRMAQGRTTIMIAHRISTVHQCDKIIVLEQGHIAEQGNHEELMGLRGIYYNLCVQQGVCYV